MDIIIIFQIVVLVMSAIVHEYMHGWMADYLGDTTAKDAGRLTLNPIPHIDPLGSIFLPLIMVVSGSPFVFGWAKPVPYNPYNLRDKKYGAVKVALAGPMSNLALALFFGLILRFVFTFQPGWAFINESFILFLMVIVQINLLLMVFNLVPIPPLDGSKVIAPFLPAHIQQKFYEMERYGFFVLILFLMFGFSLIIPIINFLYKLIVGI